MNLETKNCGNGHNSLPFYKNIHVQAAQMETLHFIMFTTTAEFKQLVCVMLLMTMIMRLRGLATLDYEKSRFNSSVFIESAAKTFDKRCVSFIYKFK